MTFQPVEPGVTDSFESLSQSSGRRTLFPVFPKYRTIRELGSGGLGTVWLAQNLDNRRYLAVKRINIVAACVGHHERMMTPQEMTHYAKKLVLEARILKQLKVFPGVPELLGVRRSGVYVELAMEYVRSIPLDKKKICESQARFIFRELLSTLKYCHTRRVAHLDIKPSNILIDLEGKPILIDFGEARFFNPETKAVLRGISNGTLEYRKPATDDPVELDLYALGKTCKSVLRKTASVEAKKFIALCLEGDKSIEELQQHEWFA